ncbi:transposase [Scytonema sp. HK-05]|uniref:hypothetical protein n=1 Tax=Scytonema sp. HK-05 TaxID=1137095 RepID=UPI0009366A32|nr:hypothetical protein NIES2130_33970 [Scytonema sp. HK-05]BAY46800.1 transposase [Scytonema sp. HK-05]
MVVSKRESYIKVIDWIADKAFETLTQTGRLTVIVQDNGSLHTSHLTQQQWQRWQNKGWVTTIEKSAEPEEKPPMYKYCCMPPKSQVWASKRLDRWR